MARRAGGAAQCGQKQLDERDCRLRASHRLRAAGDDARRIDGCSTAIDGWPIELADTAGLRAAEGQIEAEGVARALAEILAADAVLFVADTAADWEVERFTKVAGEAKRLLVIHNKSDLLPSPDDGRPPGVAASAKTGSGIEELCGAIAELLVPDPPLLGKAVPFTEQQVAGLRDAEVCLGRGQLSAAQAALLALCGTDHVLGAD